MSEGIVYDYDLDESLISKKMLKHSKVSYLLADGSKINGKSFFKSVILMNVQKFFAKALVH